MWFLRLFFSALLAGGLQLLYFGWQQHQAAQATAKWPTVEGTILRSEVKDEGSFKSPYSVGLTYRYSVGGRQYEGHRLTTADYTTSSYGEIAKQIAKYPVGATVPVYYAPASPRESLLQPGDAPGASIFFIVGGVFTFIGGSLLLSSFRTPITDDSESQPGQPRG